MKIKIKLKGKRSIIKEIVFQRGQFNVEVLDSDFEGIITGVFDNITGEKLAPFTSKLPFVKTKRMTFNLELKKIFLINKNTRTIQRYSKFDDVKEINANQSYTELNHWPTEEEYFQETKEW